MEEALHQVLFEKVIDAVDTVAQLMGKVWDLATSNPLIAVSFAVGLVFTGVAVFRGMKRAAR